MAGQDIKKRIEAGGVTHINVGGDYLFLKFADRPVNVIITGGPSGGSRVTMEAGDKYRPGQFQAFEVENPDPDNPAQIIFTVGTGDYNRQIITGNVSVTPSVQTADGTYTDDTRYDLAITVAIDGDFVPKSYARKDATAVFSMTGTDSGAAMRGAGDTLAHYTGFDALENKFFYGLWDPKTGASLGTVALRRTGVGGTYYSINAIAHYSGNVYLAINSDGKLITARDATSGYSVGNTVRRPLYITYGGGLAYVLTDDGFGNNHVEVWTVGNPGTRVETLDLTALTGRVFADAVDVVDGVLYVADAVGQWLCAIVLETGTVLYNETGWAIAEGLVVVGENAYTSQHAGTSAAVTALALEAYTLAAKGSAVAGAGGASLVRFFKPADNDFITKADVTFSTTGGVITLSGELIRAALEMYYRKELEPAYLDHVHGLVINSYVTGPNLPPGQQITKSNGKTFKAAKIADDFRQVLPGNLILTLDNGLTFKE